MKDHFIKLKSLQPDKRFDDLEPFKSIIGNARVIALGENSHFIREFCLFRHRILRFLIERCGFKLHLMEFGFSEGFEVSRWIQGESGTSDLDTLFKPFPCPDELRNTLLWQRDYNTKSGNQVGFGGIDIPRAGGSLIPSLSKLQEFFQEADPEVLPLLNVIMKQAIEIEGNSMAAAAPLLIRHNTEFKHQLTSNLNRLHLRLYALMPQHIEKFGKERFNEVCHHAKSVCYTEYNLMAMGGFIQGNGLAGDMGVRDQFMAESVMWHLEHASPNTKIILVAHNAHIQKSPVTYGGEWDFPLGMRLKKMLGNDYRSFGITSLAGETAALYPDEQTKLGFRIENTQLPPAPDNSVEKFINEIEFNIGLVDFQNMNSTTDRLKYIRYDNDFMNIQVNKAFDGLFWVPESTVADGIC